MAELQQSILVTAVMEWTITQGAEGAGKKPGLWKGKTNKYSVKLNPHNKEIDSVPAYTLVVKDESAFLAMAALPLVGEFCLIIGLDERGLIKHFTELCQQNETEDRD